MSRWLPTPEEERWLEIAARLRRAIPHGVVGERTGGWRSAGPFARIALFVLGVLAAALAMAALGFGDEPTELVTGLLAAFAAEWLKVSRRLHASGVEEGLCTAGYLLIGTWIAGQAGALLGHAHADWFELSVIVATGAAGLRLLNPALTTCGALVAVNWSGSTPLARAIGGAAGGGTTAFVLAFAAAAIALRAGAQEFRRPSHDRMLDGLVVVLPAFAYQQLAWWGHVSASPGATPSAAVRLVTTSLLVAFGIACLATGLRRRRHPPIVAFLGCLACLAVEWARSTTWPAEYWLVLYGTLAIGVAAAVERHYRSARDGITSARLTDNEGPLDLLQAAGAAVLAQQTGPPVPGETSVPPHEGRFGGGGASGQF